MAFAHLHVHSEYTFHGSTIRVEMLPQKIRELGMTAVALTDRDALHGLAAFARHARAAGVKPIAGMEATLNPESYPELMTGRFRPLRLTVLCRNAAGYRNLVRLASLRGRSLRGVPLEALHELRRGLIVLSGGMAGPISQLIIRQMVDQVYGAASELAGLLEEGSFFLEVRRMGHPAEDWVNSVLVDFAGRLSIPLVATHDCRAVGPEDEELLRALRGFSPREPNFERELPDEAIGGLFLRSPAEMSQAFRQLPAAVAAAGAIADLCEDVVPVRLTTSARRDRPGLQELAAQALARDPILRLPHYVQRLGEELSLVARSGSEPAILRSLEAAAAIRDQDGVVGPLLDPFGNTLLARALGLSEIDPLEEGLHAERYFNPEAPVPPGPLTLTVDEHGRQLLEAHLARDGGQVLAPALPERSLDREVLIELLAAWGHEPARVREYVEQMPFTLDFMREICAVFPPPETPIGTCPLVPEMVRRLTGLPTSVLAHPAALVVVPEEAAALVPTFSPGTPASALQWPEGELELLGLPACHALQIGTLGLVRRVAREVGLRALPTRDPETFAMLARGEVEGVYGFLGPDAAELARAPWPHTFTGLAALLAFLQPSRARLRDRYRTGLGQLDRLPERIRPALAETGGILLFPDQFISLVVELAGLPARKADALLRRAVERPETVPAAERRLVKSAQRHGLSASGARRFFSGLLATAPLQSEKNRALAAALLAYKTAYLKCHYPAAMLAGQLRELLDSGDLAGGYRRAAAERLLAEAGRAGITLEGDPWSAASVEAEKGRIRFRRSRPRPPRI